MAKQALAFMTCTQMQAQKLTYVGGDIPLARARCTYRDVDKKMSTAHVSHCEPILEKFGVRRGVVLPTAVLKQHWVSNTALRLLARDARHAC